MYIKLTIPILLCFGSIGCQLNQSKIQVTYETEIINKIENDYSGIDTTYIFTQDNMLKKSTKGETSFQIFDNNKKTRTNYYYSDIDSTHYKTETTSQKKVEINYTNKQKQILGYNSNSAIITSQEDTIFVFYTTEIKEKYSPLGNLDGFVLEYEHFNKNEIIKTKAININESNQEILKFKHDYIDISMADYEDIFRNYHNSRLKTNLIEEGMMAPQFEVKDINNNQIDTRVNDDKIQILNFWSIACKPCIKEFPELNMLVEYFEGNDDIIFYGITSDYVSRINRLLSRKKFKFTIIPRGIEIEKIFGVNSHPLTVIIDRNGVVAKVYDYKEFHDKGITNVISEIESIHTAHNTR